MSIFLITFQGHIRNACVATSANIILYTSRVCWINKLLTVVNSKKLYTFSFFFRLML
jgi:hypothetical protein